MELAIILMMLLVVVSAGAIIISTPNTNYVFKPKGQLFTPVERSFLQLLEQAVGNEFKIICRVKLSDLVTVRNPLRKKQMSDALSKTSAKHLDFVLCDRKSLDPVMAVDLVYRQGTESYKAQKDLFVTNALDNANIPLARIKVKSGYSLEEIKDCVETKLIPLRRRQQKLAETKMTVEKPNRPTRPLRSSRAAA